MIYLNDSSRMWHVSKVGNDANSGHAGQYPVNLASDSKLTIQATVDAAASGDTIIIWPGDYAENVVISGKVLTLIGSSRSKSRIVTTSGNGLTLVDDCTVQNLAVNSTGTGAIGIKGTGSSCTANNVVIRDCNVYGAYDGLKIASSTDLWLLNSRFAAGYDGANVTSTERLIIDRCIFVGDGSYGTGAPTRGLMAGGAVGTIKNSVFWGERDDESSSEVAGAVLGYLDYTHCQLSFNNCSFYAVGGADLTGKAAGIQINGSQARVTIQNCVIKATAPAATVYDIDVLAGSVAISASIYDTTKTNGTITAGGSGLMDAVNAEVDVVFAETTASKMLLNKAVQNKASGEVVYYDDDGVTPILTHTPSEDGSSITRIPS